MEALLAICAVIAGVVLAGAAIYFLSWVVFVVGIVALVAFALSAATGLSFWPSFWIVAALGVVGWIALVLFGEL